MLGRMGSNCVTIQNLRVLKIDKDHAISSRKRKEKNYHKEDLFKEGLIEKSTQVGLSNRWNRSGSQIQ